jgi:hypothetical protein
MIGNLRKFFILRSVEVSTLIRMLRIIAISKIPPMLLSPQPSVICWTRHSIFQTYSCLFLASTYQCWLA